MGTELGGRLPSRPGPRGPSGGVGGPGSAQCGCSPPQPCSPGLPHGTSSRWGQGTGPAPPAAEYRPCSQNLLQWPSARSQRPSPKDTLSPGAHGSQERWLLREG